MNEGIKGFDDDNWNSIGGQGGGGGGEEIGKWWDRRRLVEVEGMESAYGDINGRHILGKMSVEGDILLYKSW